MRNVDHFHAKYRHDNETHEIEGGFTFFPENWDRWDEAQRKAYFINLCVSWGMPPDAELKSIHFAG